jgi:hypothetical protein
MRVLKLLLIPAALALAPAAMAAPTSPGGRADDEVMSGIETTPVYHRGYWHDRYYYGPPRRYWRGHRYGHRYYYGPRCYWSRYWHRTVCR